jgi:hypothetical protein
MQLQLKVIKAILGFSGFLQEEVGSPSIQSHAPDYIIIGKRHTAKPELPLTTGLAAGLDCGQRLSCEHQQSSISS